MVSRYGVYYDLSMSAYSSELEGIKYYFSSALHCVKFNKEYLANRNKVNTSLSKRFGFKIEANKIADISLYLRIETRGTYIVKDGCVITCKSQIKLDGLNMMKIS